MLIHVSNTWTKWLPICRRRCKCISFNENLSTLTQNRWSLFRRVRLTTCKHWFGWWLGVEQGTTTKGDKIYRRMYASLGLNESAQYLSYRQRKFYRRHIEMRFVHSSFLKLIPMSFKIVAVRFDRQSQHWFRGKPMPEPMVTAFY